MDRERLKEVHQSDLTEGRINQDFLDWLQTKGMSYLMILLVGICAYSAWIYYKRNQTNYRAEAWSELSKAALPGSLQDIADKYSDVGSVSHLARLRAADEYLAAVQQGKQLGAAPGTDAAPLTEKDRTDYLDRADGLYQKVVDADDQSAEKTLLAVTALTGRAVVAESRGELDKAKDYYNHAAQRAEALYPKLAEQSRHRADSVGGLDLDVALPTNEQLEAMKPTPMLEPSTTDAPPSITPDVLDIIKKAQGDGSSAPGSAPATQPGG